MYSLGPKKKSLGIQTLSGRSGWKNWITIEKQILYSPILIHKCHKSISPFFHFSYLFLHFFSFLTHLHPPFFNFPHLLQNIFSSSHIWSLLSFLFSPFSCTSLHISSIFYCLYISSVFSCLQEIEAHPLAYYTALRITMTWMKGINIYQFFLPPLCFFHFHPLLTSHLFSVCLLPLSSLFLQLFFPFLFPLTFCICPLTV